MNQLTMNQLAQLFTLLFFHPGNVMFTHFRFIPQPLASHSRRIRASCDASLIDPGRKARNSLFSETPCTSHEAIAPHIGGVITAITPEEEAERSFL